MGLAVATRQQTTPQVARSGIYAFSAGVDVPQRSRYGAYDFFDFQAVLESTMAWVFAWIVAETSPEWRPAHVRCDLSYLQQRFRIGKKQLGNIRKKLLDLKLVSSLPRRRWSLTAHPEIIRTLPLREFEERRHKPPGVATEAHPVVQKAKQPEIHFPSEVVQIGIQKANGTEMYFRSSESYCFWAHDCAHKFSELAAAKSLDNTEEESSSSELSATTTEDDHGIGKDDAGKADEYPGCEGTDISQSSSETNRGYANDGRAERKDRANRSGDGAGGGEREHAVDPGWKARAVAERSLSSRGAAPIDAAARSNHRGVPVGLIEAITIEIGAKDDAYVAGLYKACRKCPDVTDDDIINAIHLKAPEARRANNPAGFLKTCVINEVTSEKTRAHLRASQSAKKHGDISERTYPACACGNPIVIAGAPVCFDCEQRGKPSP